MDCLKLRNMENILYRMDTVEERAEMLYNWTILKQIDSNGFMILVKQCNEEDVLRDSKRKNN